MRQIRPTTLPVLLAVLVVAATATVAVATAAPSVPGNGTAPDEGDRSLLVLRSQSNATNFLDVRGEDAQRDDYGDGTMDAAGAVSMDVERIRGEYASRSFGASYGGLSEETARADRLETEVTRLERQVERLERRQERAIDDYNDERLTTEQFLRELATIDVAARTVDSRFDHLRQSAGLAMPNDLQVRIDSLEADLIPLRGPVRARAGSAITGEESAVKVYALTSQDSVVLSTTDGQRFHREAYVPGDRQAGGTDNFVTEDDPTGIRPAIDRTSELYPWTYDNLDAGPRLDGFGQTSVYAVSIGHPHGNLDTFLDGTTRNVFREYQELRLDRVPTEATTNSTSSVVLRVERTYGTGPMQVTAMNPTTGEPVDASVRVNGEVVGRTGDDGALWTVTPHRPVRIEIHAAEGTASLAFFAE